MKWLMSTVAPLLLLSAVSVAQEAGPDIDSYLARVEKGEADAVRAEIPSLLTKHPNNPGVLYLQGVVTTDGTEAVRIYQSIVDNFPRSDWADDALYKVYQFYYAIGLYRTAEIKLNQLKTDYPQSKFVSSGSQHDTKELAEEKPPPDTVVVADAVQIDRQPVVTDDSGPGTRHPSSQAVEAPKSAQYTLQVGAFTQQANAEKQKAFFEDLGYAVEVVNTVRDSRSLFIVLVGEFPSADAARAKGAEIKKKHNVGSMVVTR